MYSASMMILTPLSFACRQIRLRSSLSSLSECRSSGVSEVSDAGCADLSERITRSVGSGQPGKTTFNPGTFVSRVLTRCDEKSTRVRALGNRAV